MQQDYTAFVLIALLIAGLVAWLTTPNRNAGGAGPVQSGSRLPGLGLILAGALAAAFLWGDISGSNQQQAVFGNEGKIVLPRERDGHYYLTALVNGAPVRFTVDTGATSIVLSHADAIAAGIDPAALAYIGTANTANGEVRTAPVRLESLTVGAISDTNLRAYINEGEMDGSLLGMSYLQRFSKIEITDGALTLTR